MPARITLVETSSRVAPGLLTAPAWDLLRSASVWTASPEHPQLDALREAGVEVSLLTEPLLTDPSPRGSSATASSVSGPSAGAAPVAALLAAPGPGERVAWLLDPAAPTAADRALRALVAAPGDPEVDLLVATRELPGSALLDAVAVMDRLRSPGGCPWDAEQTHASLAPYLLEEAYEAYQAIEDGDLAELREELGDVLMQVLFHARVAAEAGPAGWDVDDVAAGLSAKLVRRHPHVFGDVVVGGADDVVTNWDAIKAQEKGRKSVTEGVPLSAPALFLTAKLLRRATGIGLPADLALPAPGGLPGGATDDPARLVAELARQLGPDPAAAADGQLGPHGPAVADTRAGGGAQAGGGEDAAGPAPADPRIGDLLFAAVALARVRGVDPETALRARARVFRDRLAAAEHAALARGVDPRALDAGTWRSLWAAPTAAAADAALADPATR